ncbi:MAG TPA: hypothetical protein VKK61_11595 [Tepidisphaeraceae bacterium]|nr:hypothetical protein [Tepidisphaeraceae bacterium]
MPRFLRSWRICVMTVLIACCAAPSTQASPSERLNDFTQWAVRGGRWEKNSDGQIVGYGDATLEFNGGVPANSTIEFSINVVAGMRPRIHFDGTDAYIGNEGFTHRLELYNCQSARGVPLPYDNGQDIKIAVKFKGNRVEFFINDELMARGTTKSTADQIGITLRAGDNFSPGQVRFWNFKVSPAH